jgi:nucleoside-diphosphate-sugar epimerase
MHILITGGAGCLDSRLVRTLPARRTLVGQTIQYLT